MLRGEIDATGADGPDALLEAYASVLRGTVDRLGAATVVDRSGRARETIDDVAAGDVGDLTLEDAAAVVAADPARPDANAVAAEARDIILLGMTTAVLDVERLASAMDGAMDPKAIQQKIEGRREMSLSEYAAIHYQLREHTE